MMINKIVSLIPSATEIIFTLEQGQKLVGRSHSCDFPECVKTLPVLTKANVEYEHQTSSQIDNDVKQILSDGISIYAINQELLRSLEPDLIITQDQCDVCAVSLADVQKVVSEWVGMSTKIISLKPETLEDVLSDIQKVADAIFISEVGKKNVEFIKKNVFEVAEKAKNESKHKTIASIEWIDPIMTAGNWMPELIEYAGGINLFGEAGKHSPWIKWEDILNADPDMIIVMPCGFDIAKSVREMETLKKQHGWSQLKAVKTGNVYITDGNQYFNRPGPRLKESLEILAEIINPHLFNFGHREKAWIQYQN